MENNRLSTKEIEVYLTNELLDLRSKYILNPYPSYQERKNKLRVLKDILSTYKYRLRDAMSKDFGYRSDFDSIMTDIAPSIMAIDYTIKRLKSWMKSSKRKPGLALTPASVKVQYQPLGVVGIISPWNFPIYLSLGPAIQALAAGNKVLIKVSEFTPHTNGVLREILKPLKDDVLIIEGDGEVGKVFSQLQFDHLLFTGSTKVGRLVAIEASKNLVPITLELGGKSPVIIDKNSDMRKAVENIMLGKIINSGQICVAPDYVFVHQDSVDTFTELFIEKYKELYNSKFENNQTHIISEKHVSRLYNLIKDAVSKGGVMHGLDTTKAEGKLFHPKVVTNVNDSMLVMQEEIFGTILPVMTYNEIDECIRYINKHDRPLALYIMSNNKKLINSIINTTHSGGVSVNDTTLHVMAEDAPFGGIGPSGMGQYHGHEGFLTFSNAKTVLRSGERFGRSKLVLSRRDFITKLAYKTILKTKTKNKEEAWQ